MTSISVTRWPFFVMGMVFACGLNMAYQDWIGIDRYIAEVQAGWVETTWWGDLIIAGAAFVGCSIPFQAIAQKFNPCVGCALMDFLYAQPRVGAALADCTAEQHAEIHNGLRAITWKAAELGLLKS